MASSNNNKGLAANSPITTLNQLQSELYGLREKHIHALEAALATLEKEEDKQKALIDKTRAQLKQYQDRLKDPKNAKPSAQGRLKASLASAQRNFDSDQAALAQLRSNIIEQRLTIRKEKAVLKAMLDTEKSLSKTAAKPVSKASPAKASPTPAKAPPKTPAKAKVSKTKVAAKIEANVATPSAAKKPDTAKSTPQDAPADKAMAAVKSELAASVAETLAEPKKQDSAAIAPKPKRRVRRMSDIPSHPDKPADRLASLFDDF